MQRRSVTPIVGLLLLCLTTSASSGCGHRNAGARTVMALGAIAMVAGLLVAGGCEDDEQDQRTTVCGSSGGGHPEIGAPLAAVGLAALAAGDAANRAQPGPRRHRAKTAMPPPASPDPNPAALNEPLAGTPLIPIVR